MEQGIKEVDKSTSSLGKIPGAGVPPPPPLNSSFQQENISKSEVDKSQLIADIRRKLLEKVNLTDTFEIEGVKYTLRVLDRKDLGVANSRVIKDLSLRETEWFDPKKTVFEQLGSADATSVILIGGYILQKAILKIDDIPVEELFSSDSPITLEEFMNSSSTPLMSIFDKYLELIKRDKATIIDVKN